jgi:protein-tyrosine sulfotransferase
MTEGAASRLIFVGGSPRSGTTLLQNMLDSHPEIIGAPEFLHLTDIVRLRRALHGSIGTGRISSYCSETSVDALVREMIMSFLLPLWNRSGRTYLSEKTPENVLVFSELIGLFPESRFLHIVRDPRAIVASMLEVAKKARARNLKPASYTTSVAAATAHTRKCIVSGFQAAKEYPEKICTIAYERLVESSASETERICAFLEIPWSQSMLEPGGRSHLGEVVMTSKTNEIWYDKGSFTRNPVTDSVAKWRKQLTHREQLAVMEAFADVPEFAELGYDVPPSGSETHDRGSGAEGRPIESVTDRCGPNR